MHRDERAIWRVYSRGCELRQSFHDGVCVAELLVAARRRATEQDLEKAEQGAGRRRQREAIPAAEAHGTCGWGSGWPSAIAGSDRLIETIPAQSKHQKSRAPMAACDSPGEPPPRNPETGCAGASVAPDLSWQAAYNTACLYAALASQRLAASKADAGGKPAERERGSGGSSSAWNASSTTSTPRWNARMTWSPRIPISPR